MNYHRRIYLASLQRRELKIRAAKFSAQLMHGQKKKKKNVRFFLYFFFLLSAGGLTKLSISKKTVVDQEAQISLTRAWGNERN